MSFFHVPVQHYLANTPDSCKVSLTRLSGRAKHQIGIRLAIGSNVMTALKAQFGDRTQILWGKDEDVGKILLQKSERGVTVKKTRASKAHAGYMTFTGVPTAPIRGANGERVRIKATPQPAKTTQWQAAQNRGIIINLPLEWLEPAPESNKDALKALVAVPMPPPAPTPRIVA